MTGLLEDAWTTSGPSQLNRRRLRTVPRPSVAIADSRTRYADGCEVYDVEDASLSRRHEVWLNPLGWASSFLAGQFHGGFNNRGDRIYVVYFFKYGNSAEGVAGEGEQRCSGIRCVSFALREGRTGVPQPGGPGEISEGAVVQCIHSVNSMDRAVIVGRYCSNSPLGTFIHIVTFCFLQTDAPLSFTVVADQAFAVRPTEVCCPDGPPEPGISHTVLESCRCAHIRHPYCTALSTVSIVPTAAMEAVKGARMVSCATVIRPPPLASCTVNAAHSRRETTVRSTRTLRPRVRARRSAANAFDPTRTVAPSRSRAARERIFLNCPRDDLTCRAIRNHPTNAPADHTGVDSEPPIACSTVHAMKTADDASTALLPRAHPNATK